jgi:hypothetical protein
LQAELRQLEAAIRELAKELAIQQEALAKRKMEGAGGGGDVAGDAPDEPGPQGSQPKSTPTKREDRFVPVVRAFLDEARKKMAELQEEHTEMTQKVGVVLGGIIIKNNIAD